MASRKLEHLHKDMRPKVERWLARCATEAKVGILVTQTWRSAPEHRAYWLQGRGSLEEVNEARAAANLAPITDAENRKKVTWVKWSKHMDLENGQPASRAVDFCVLKDGKAVWDVKADIDRDGIADYEEIGAIAEEEGLVWGGRWTTPDYPHVEEA